MSRLNRLSRITAITAVVVAAALTSTGLVACTGKDAVDTSSAGNYRFVTANRPGQVFAVAERKPVGAVTGTLMNGSPYSLAAARGKVVVINFWATWCGPCKTETPQFDALYRQVAAQGIDFVGIDTKELSRDAGTSFIADNKISYPIVWDEPGKTALELGHVPAASLPFTVVIDKDQRVAAVYLQALSPADLRPVLTSLVAEQ
jgi:thiol-disulfide isomerase/thioredoxin